MQLKTILNQVTEYKSFVFGKVAWVENADQLALVKQLKHDGYEPHLKGGRWLLTKTLTKSPP